MSEWDRYESARVGVRLASGLVDLILITLVIEPIGVLWYGLSYVSINEGTPLLHGPFDLALSLGPFPALAVCWSQWGTSPGGWLMGLRVVDRQSGEHPGVGRSMIRSLGLLASSLPLFYGFWAARRPPHQAWHDRMSRTVVLDLVATRWLKTSAKSIDDGVRRNQSRLSSDLLKAAVPLMLLVLAIDLGITVQAAVADWESRQHPVPELPILATALRAAGQALAMGLIALLAFNGRTRADVHALVLFYFLVFLNASTLESLGLPATAAAGLRGAFLGIGILALLRFATNFPERLPTRVLRGWAEARPPGALDRFIRIGERVSRRIGRKDATELAHPSELSWDAALATTGPRISELLGDPPPIASLAFVGVAAWILSSLGSEGEPTWVEALGFVFAASLGAGLCFWAVAILRRRYGVASSTDRDRMRWVVLGTALLVLAPIVGFVGVAATDMFFAAAQTVESRAVAEDYVDVLLAVLVFAGVATTAAGVLVHGAMGADSRIRRALLTGGVGLVVVVVFATLDVVLADAVASAAGLPSRWGAWIAAMTVIVLGTPLHRFTQSAASRVVDTILESENPAQI